MKTKNLLQKTLITVLIAVIVIPLATYSILRWALSRENISYPAQDHSHFRIKYIFEGQEENFGSPRYQTDYTKDICNGDLTTSPLHFHDNKADYQHQHWAKMTGGQMLKFYGYNLIGGLDGYLGFKLDQFPKVTPVPIHSVSLPKPRPNSQFWIYTGIENSDGSWTTTAKSKDNFVNQDLETFFGQESQARKDIERYKVTSNPVLKIIFKPIQSQAHSGIEHKSATEEQTHLMNEREKLEATIRNNTASSNISSISKPTNSKEIEKDPITGEELKSINNFLGDVVIFVQADEPTADQIQTRFRSMVKLDKSTCGG